MSDHFVMRTDVEELRLQIDSLRLELASSRSRIETLKRRHHPQRTSHRAIIACAISSVFALAFWASAQSTHTGSVFPAPFVIVDEHDTPIFAVKEAVPQPQKADGSPPQPPGATSLRGAYVFNGRAQASAALQAIAGGGAVRAFDPANSERRVTMAATFDDVSLSVKNNKSLIYAGSSGIVAVYGATNAVATIEAKVENGKGFVGVWDTQKIGEPLVYLSESKIGTGEVVGKDAAGGLGWFFVGTPGGASCCANRNKHQFCLGPHVWLSE